MTIWILVIIGHVAQGGVTGADRVPHGVNFGSGYSYETLQECKEVGEEEARELLWRGYFCWPIDISTLEDRTRTQEWNIEPKPGSCSAERCAGDE